MFLFCEILKSKFTFFNNARHEYHAFVFFFYNVRDNSLEIETTMKSKNISYP